MSSHRVAVAVVLAVLGSALFTGYAHSSPGIETVRAQHDAALQLTSHTGSITFIQNGNVFILDPEADAPQQVTTGGGYAWPSQDDSGRIVAVRRSSDGSRRLHRMNRSGVPLNDPIETVPTDNSFYVGPLMPKVSPDGTYVAYHYFLNSSPTTNGDPTVCYSYADRDTTPGELGCLEGYTSPSWLDNTHPITFATPDFADQVFVDNVGGQDTFFWFTDEGADSLAQGEVSRNMTRFAAVASAGGQPQIRLYEMEQPPPAEPVPACAIIDPTGYFEEPTWSPDGSFLLYEDGEGIWAASVPTLADCTQITPALILPGAEDPDWSPAPYTAPGPGPDPEPVALDVGVRLASPQSLNVLLDGLRPKVTCSAACGFTVKLVADAATSRRFDLGSSATVVGSRSSSLGSAGRKAVTVELTRRAKRKFRGATRAFDLMVKVVGTDASGSQDRATKTVRIVP